MKATAMSFALSTGLLIAGPIVAAGEKEGLSINPGIGYYTFDSDMNIEDQSFPSLGLEYRLPNNFAIEGTYITTETNNVSNSDTNFDWSHYHLDALYYFNSTRKLQPYLAAGAGEGSFNYSSDRSSDNETLLNIGGGIKFFFTPTLSLRGDFRLVNSQDNEMTAGTTSLVLSWLLGPSTSMDSQGEFGLAEPITVDADKDGIVDAIDLCPGTPPSVTSDSNGCATDLDNDGIADYRDKCNSTPANIPVNSVGCPQDLDQDGIADYQDQCLGSKKGLQIDSDGCAVNITETVSMNLNVNFPSNSSTLPRELFQEVQELATFMKRYNDTIAVIEGHSDNAGNANYNRFLSQKRAETIRKILITQFNISEERLRAIGYGEDYPVASNQTSEGRQQNRRVIAIINTGTEKN